MLSVNTTNNRHFERADNTQRVFPVVLTVWSLFTRATSAEVTTIINNCLAAGVNGVAAVLLNETEGPNGVDTNGYKPFSTHDWTDASASKVAGFWNNVQAIITAFNNAGITMFLLPTWGKWVVAAEAYAYFSPLSGGPGGSGTGRPADLTAAKARAVSYGNFLASTLTGDIVWVLGGDVGDGADYWANQNQIWDAMSEGLTDGAGGNIACMFHPGYASFTSAGMHNRANGDSFEWLLAHGAQASHFTFDDEDVYLRADAHYARTAPVRPFGELEAFYHRSPRGSSGNDPPVHDGRYAEYDQRLAFWWSVGRGGAQYWFSTFALWQLWKTGRTALYGTCENEWSVEIASSGVSRMKYSRWLINRLPSSLFFSRTQFPNATLLPSQSSINQHRKVATGNWDGTKCTWAYVYFPASGWDPVGNSWAGSHTVAVDLTKFDSAGGDVKAWWYNPRTGVATEAKGAGWAGNPGPLPGEFPEPLETNRYARVSTQFTKPHDSANFAQTYTRGNDWILILVSVNETSLVVDPSYPAGSLTVSAVVGATGTLVELTFNQEVEIPLGLAVEDFKFTIDGDGDYVGSLASVGSNTITLELQGVTVNSGQTVVMNYGQVTLNGFISDVAGRRLGALSDVAVTNNSEVGGGGSSTGNNTIKLGLRDPLEI